MIDRDGPSPPHRDILLAALLQLEPLSPEMSEQALIESGVEIAQAVTSSRIAYLHYLNDDENTIELGVWSRDTHGYCTAIYDRHYPVDAAGIWADSVRRRAPCIHNDYPNTPHRRGMPEGHSPLSRHLGVPVIDDGKVRMLFGVGNKDTDYDDRDVAMLNVVARRVWSMVRQRRAVERWQNMERRMRRIQEIADVCGWEYDVDDDRFTFDAMFSRLFHTRRADDVPRDLRAWLEFVDADDHDRLRRVLTASSAATRCALRIGCRRADGEGFAAELKIEFRHREVGQGVIAVGILQDVTGQLEVEDLRRRADIDALTGLPNRHRLATVFEQGLDDSSGGGEVAFLFLDLDGFKPVNDTHGHRVGDEVLRIVAHRLRHAVRRDDLVVRLGGDEFGVVLTGVATPQAATQLAASIIASVSEPIALGGLTVSVGASIGIALRPDFSRGLDELAHAADQALYRAKALGGNRWVAE